MLLINFTTFDMSAQYINFTCYIACLLLSSASCMRKNTYELFKNSDGWHRFDEQFISLFNVSRMQCTGYCDQRLNCLSINYNSNLKECELTETYPVESSTSYVSETDWRTYFSYTAVYDRNLMSGAVTWQSSTHSYGAASVALDGNTDGNYFARSCSHTENPDGAFWAMEFGLEGPVGRIIFYFRSDCCSDRNMEIHFLVSKTRHDLDNDVGTLCARYMGPASDPGVPATISCGAFTYGIYLLQSFRSKVGIW